MGLRSGQTGMRLCPPNPRPARLPRQPPTPASWPVFPSGEFISAKQRGTSDGRDDLG